MHITLVFIGQADEALCDGVKAALDSPLQTPAFDLTVSGTGSFPLGRPPRVLWAGLTAGRDRLIQLEREVRSRLASLPVPRDDRPYSPHLTLARVKHPAGLRPKSLLAGFEDASFGTVRVRTVTLFESRLGRQRPEYVGMAGWWLGEPGALSPEP
jgi:2'-5' RNA ligase